MIKTRIAFSATALFAALALAAPLTAQESKAAGWTDEAAGEVQLPGLTFEAAEKNFGTADEGETVQIEFPFINTSDRTITISNIKASCGCTTPELAKKVFAPGEGETIHAAFNTKGRTGNQAKTITITTDDPASPTYRISFQGEVVSKVYLDEKLVNFGTVDQGEEATQTIHVVDMSGADISVKNVTSSAGGLKIEVGEAAEHTDAATGRTGRAIPVTVTVPADYPQGPLATTVAIQTDYTDRPSFIATVRGIVRGEVTVQPAQVYFGFVQPETEVKRNFSLSVVANKTFELKSYSIDADESRAPANAETPLIEVIEAPGSTPVEQNYVVLFVAPDTDNGRFTGDIILEGLVSGEMRTLRVPYNAFVRSTAQQAPAASSEDRVRAALQQRAQQVGQPVIVSPRIEEAKTNE